MENTRKIEELAFILCVKARIVLSSHVCKDHPTGDCSDREILLQTIAEIDKALGKSSELKF